MEHLLAVDHHRQDITGGSGFEFGKDTADTGGLAGARRPADDGVEGPGTPECGTECLCKLPELLVAGVDGIRGKIGIKDVLILKECLVVHG